MALSTTISRLVGVYWNFNPVHLGNLCSILLLSDFAFYFYLNVIAVGHFRCLCE